MALKVLLADESSSIKKAFQLSLAEFALDIKTVPSGLDVVPVALDFKPDIIFADILLSKKNGYDTCGEIKAHEKLKSTPVVLMWSNFMDFNMPLALKNGATDKLEKPFDSQMLKELVKRLVPKTTPHPLDGFLVNPRLPDFTESEAEVRSKSDFDLKSTESTKFTDLDSDEFQSVKLQLGTSEAAVEHMQPSETMVTDSLSGYDQTAVSFNEMDIEPTPVPKSTITKSAPTPSEKSKPIQNPKNPQQDPKPKQSENSDFNDIHIETESFGQFEEVVSVQADRELDDLESEIGKNIQEYIADTTVARMHSQTNAPAKKSRFDEQMMREEIRMVAEKICWQVIPDVAERIVREEIQKLMKNIEKSI